MSDKEIFTREETSNLIQQARKQGALEELKKLLPRFETFESCEYKIKLIIEKRIKELEGDKK